uniref:G-protein coupled receptors family 1 profile domain-containing protein n=1 Tax=Marmota marmota marmota TaxID=9994 RepID=A0A8C5ZK97_MARMA
MSASFKGSNNSKFQVSEFILMGFPGIHSWQHWLSLPLALLYLSTIGANILILTTIYQDSSLKQPMYLFLGILSVVDMGLSTTIVPKILAIFWFDAKETGFDECLVQMFFIHTFTGMESGVLMLMALDRYVAICYPLHYSVILTNDVIGKVGLATFLRGVLLITPFTFLTKRLPYCRGNVIPHTYCDHMSVAKLSCGNVKVNAIYGLMVALLIGGFDILCITVSYTMILRAVVSLSSADARQKAFSTCTAHICAVVFSYSPAFFSFFSHHFGGHTIPPSCHIIMANIYMLLPPTMNPVVYGDTKSHNI